MSYSVALEADRTEDPARPWGAFLLFLRWRRVGAQGVEGHLETPFLAYGATPGEALQALGAMPLGEVKALLDDLLRRQRPGPERRWWDVMQDEDA